MVDIPTLTGDKIPLNLANEVIKPTTVKRIPGNIQQFVICLQLFTISIHRLWPATIKRA